MTCSKACRLRRRAKLEKARRQADLDSSRAADRQRQREHREHKRAQRGVVNAAQASALSQAGLSAEVTVVIDEIIENLRQAQHLSQAGLRRRLQRLARQFGGEIAHDPAKVET
jgi:hypothetical protein